MNDLLAFVYFFKKYVSSRLLHFGQQIEKFKDLIVALLIVKRGKYSSSFLNTSFLLLVITVLVAGPAIAENNPFTNSLDESQTRFQTSVISFDPFENSLSTVASEKPRDTVEEYPVSSGETLASIAKKFRISVDTIKWANDLKTDTIKPGQILKIPPVTGVVHKVASGENIYSIAKKYKTEAQEIVNYPFNDFSDPDTFQLTTGQTLYVPNGVIQEAQPIYSNRRFTAQAGVRGTSSFIWPTSGSITTFPASWHMALDIANSSLPAILASDTGTVTFAGCINWGYGCHIIVDHGNGYQTLYGHLSELWVAPGQSVSKGQSMGKMGSTGRSTGPHLHFEIRSGGLLNPLNFLQ